MNTIIALLCLLAFVTNATTVAKESETISVERIKRSPIFSLFFNKKEEFNLGLSHEKSNNQEKKESDDEDGNKVKVVETTYYPNKEKEHKHDHVIHIHNIHRNPDYSLNVPNPYQGCGTAYGVVCQPDNKPVIEKHYHPTFSIQVTNPNPSPGCGSGYGNSCAPQNDGPVIQLADPNRGGCGPGYGISCASQNDKPVIQLAGPNQGGCGPGYGISCASQNDRPVIQLADPNRGGCGPGYGIACVQVNKKPIIEEHYHPIYKVNLSAPVSNCGSGYGSAC